MREKGCSGSPFSHILSFHNSLFYLSNFTDIFIIVQKIISWKAGKSELICLHSDLRFCITAICYIKILLTGNGVRYSGK